MKSAKPSSVHSAVKWLLVGGLCFFVYQGWVIGSLAWRIAHPVPVELPLPESHVALDSERGQALLSQSTDKADYSGLWKSYTAQQYRSYCGVATGVMAVNAIDPEIGLSQDAWFTPDAEKVRTGWDTFFGGMTLAQFSGMIRAHGYVSEFQHGGDFDLKSFRQTVQTNLKNPRDMIVVNYARKSMGQKGGGHFSPLAAYHAAEDRVLILDVAAHKYPPTWVPLVDLWKALATPDSDSGKNRGYAIIR